MSFAADLIVLPMSNAQEAEAEYSRILEIEAELLAANKKVLFYMKQCMIVAFLNTSWDTLLRFSRGDRHDFSFKSIQNRVDITQLLVCLKLFENIVQETSDVVANLEVYHFLLSLMTILDIYDLYIMYVSTPGFL